MVLIACGGIAGLPGFFLDGEASAIFLLPFGSGFALGGFLLAINHRESVAFVAALFWEGRRRIPLAEGLWQTRAIGGIMCLIGVVLMAVGFLALLDAMGLVDVTIES